MLHDGDAVKVQVINIAPDGKIALSIKRLLPPAPRQPREGRPAGPRPGGFHNGQEGGRSGGRGAGRAPREGGRGPAREAAPRVWQPKAPARSDNLSFEDMMSRFKSQSEEKMADLDHETNNRRGGGYRGSSSRPPRDNRGGSRNGGRGYGRPSSVPERGLTGVTEREVDAFKHTLEQKGISVTRRREMGDDIEGACGQLRRRYIQDNNLNTEN